MLLRVLCVLLFLAFTAEPANANLYGGTGWRSPFQYLGWIFVSLPVIQQPLFNLLLAALAPLAFAQGLSSRRRAWPLVLAILASAGTIAVVFLWGMARGGSAYDAYFQLKGPLTGLLFALMLLATVRKSRDLRLVWTTVVAAAFIRATLALYFFLVHVRGSGVQIPFMTSHNDSLLWVTAAAWLVALALARGSRRAWLVTLVGTLYLLVAIYVNARRLAWIELAVALAVAYVVLSPPRLRRRVNRRLLLAAPLLLVYVVVGWGRSGPLFAPLEALRTTSPTAVDPSKLARNEEDANLVHTFRQSPVLGTGWGHEYVALSSVYSAVFSTGPFHQYGYLPHNSLLGTLAFSGVLGFIGTWGFVPVAAFLATRGYRRARRATDRAAAMAAVSVLPAFGMQAFGDIGFNATACWLLVALAVATGERVAAWTGAWPTRAKAPARRLLPGAAGAPSANVTPAR